MLLVKTSIHPSDIHGLGVFSNEAIKKDQVVWQHDPRIDIRFAYDELDSFPESMQYFFSIWGYVEMVDGKKVVTLSTDHARHMNHSDDPNLIDHGEKLVAAHDIAAGVELTCNYHDSDLEANHKLGKS
jgi:SET domain-containing protein